MAEPSRIADAAPRGYRVLFELGRGGMGAAFLACAEGAGGFERLVVIKRIRPERLDARSIERFLREARVAAAIHHANVVSAQSVGEDAEGPFIVLDYVDGASLDELLDRSLLKQRPLPVPIMLRVALDVLAGLQAVHEASDAQGKPLNVLHRDVSLQNVLLGRDGVARLLDFGIARSDLGGATTDQHYIVGKLPYLPPEYLRRERLDPSSDVYGLGVTLWLALTGKDLWPSASEAQVLQHILADGIPPLSQALEVAPEVVELIARACAAERTRRFGSARAMAAAIEQIDRERGWLATHHEVAEWLNTLTGLDLNRRRERIALLVNDPSPPAQDGQAPQPRAARRAGRVAWVIVGSSLLLGLLAWALSRRSAAPGPEATPSASAVSERSTVVAPAPTPAAPAAPSNAVSEPPEPAASSRARRSGRPTAPPSKPSAGSAAGVRPPDQISKRNPYRD
jgi:eukaryotic-like serine/threonine-protein kinase